MSDVAEQGPVWSLKDCKVLKVITGTITPIDLLWVRSVAPDPQMNTIPLEGDDQLEELEEVSRWPIVITCDKHDLDAVQTIFGKTKVLDPTGDDAEVWGMWFGDDTEVAGVEVGLQYDMKAKDQSSGSVLYTERVTYPKGTLKMVKPGQAEWKAKQQFVLNFEADKTTTDLLGAALSGVPTDGAYYRRGRVS